MRTGGRVLALASGVGCGKGLFEVESLEKIRLDRIFWAVGFNN